MRAGDPAIAKKTPTWTSKNPTWGAPVQRSLPDLAEGNAPNTVAQASDNGLLAMSVSGRGLPEGGLANEFKGFSASAGDFNAAGQPRGVSRSRGYK